MALRKRLKLKEPDQPAAKPKKPQGPGQGKELGACYKLDDHLIKQFCKLIRKGLPVDGVCDYLSVNNGSFWRWTQYGTRYLEGNGEEKELKIYGQFILKLRRAYAQYRLKVVKRLHHDDLEKAALWKRDIAILERRDRKTWSKLDVGSGGEDQLNVDERFL